MSDYIFQTSMRFRVDRRDPQERVFMTVFCGTTPGSRPKVGELILDIGEYQSFFAALRMGTASMIQKADEGLYVPLEITVTGEREVLGRDDIPDEVHFPIPEPPWIK